MAQPAAGGVARGRASDSDLPDPEGATRLSESFAIMVAEHMGDECAVLVFQPWSGAVGPQPASVLAPLEAGSVADLGADQIRAVVDSRQALVAPCTFELAEEEAAAWQLVPKFVGVEDFGVFMVHLIPPNLRPSKETGAAIMRRYDAMLAIGVDDVLMCPEAEPEAFRCALGLSRSVWQMNVRRMQLMLEAEPELVSEDAIKTLQKNHRSLLWEQVPRALMPQFATVTEGLRETGGSVAHYELLCRCETVAGCVLRAVDRTTSNTVIIKVVEKSQVCTPGELEGIYREFRFLTDVLDHPNINKCHRMLHSQMRVYLVFSCAGDMNLAQLLSSQPGDRLDSEDTLDVFGQMATGMAHAHSKDVSHRRICLEHVVLWHQPGSRNYDVKMVDFHHAMVARGEMVSRTVCSTLPCMAPEMALGAAYVPWRSDCWSMGVVLLEMGGGLASMSRAVPFDPRGEAAPAANAVLAFFQRDGSHAQALAYSGGVTNDVIVGKLEALLRPDPQERTPIRMMMPEPPESAA